MVNTPAVDVRSLSVFYGSHQVLKDVTFDVKRNEIFAIIGPAQSGKSSLLRLLNRTLEFTSGARWTGEVNVLGQEIRSVRSVYELRRSVGMVSPLPVGLPLTIFDNVAFAPRMAGMSSGADLAHHVERCLRQAALWDEVKDRLKDLGTRLSGGQQQRLAIARALSHEPEILCLDEFSIAIDPVTTMRIEDVLVELKSHMTIVMATNLTQQARRIAARTMFLLNGDLIEVGPTEEVFSDTPKKRETFEYLRGVFG